MILKLSTHVLDTMHGLPAAGMALTLERVDINTGDVTELVRTETNQDGRTDMPLLRDGEVSPGAYRLSFWVGDYFRRLGIRLSEPAFLEVVPICFHVSNPASSLHVPLLVSPWSYSTYRGS